MAEARAVALRAGLTHDQFWSLTPFETAEAARAALDARRDAYKLALWQAWHTAAFGRVKKLPDLKRMLDRLADRREVRPATPKALKAKIEALNAAFGGRDMRRKKAKAHG